MKRWNVNFDNKSVLDVSGSGVFVKKLICKNAEFEDYAKELGIPAVKYDLNKAIAKVVGGQKKFDVVMLRVVSNSVII